MSHFITGLIAALLAVAMIRAIDHWRAPSARACAVPWELATADRIVPAGAESTWPGIRLDAI